MCAHKKHTHSCFSLIKPTSLIESNSFIPTVFSLLQLFVLCQLWSSTVSRVLLSLCWPGPLKSGSIAVPVILQGCHRHRNRKSIKAPMNQHCWPALLGQYATLLATSPFHCLSPSLNPLSGTEKKGPITPTGLLSSPCI